MLQSNAESNHTEVELLRDKNTKFIASIARHQETISKLQEVGLVCQSVVTFRRRRKMYSGHGCLCVSLSVHLSVCPSLHSHTAAWTWM